MRNVKGFSVLELLVVVTIIGILATIGIPQYAKFKLKAQSAEASFQLNALFHAETAFFMEYNRYHSILDAVGYAPAGNFRYNVGFGRLGNQYADSSNSNFAATPSLDLSHFDTKSICMGPFGTGNDNRCFLNGDAPTIPFLSTVYANGYIAGALRDTLDLSQNNLPLGFASPVTTLVNLALTPESAFALTDGRYQGFLLTNDGRIFKGDRSSLTMSCVDHPERSYCDIVDEPNPPDPPPNQ